MKNSTSYKRRGYLRMLLNFSFYNDYEALNADFSEKKTFEISVYAVLAKYRSGRTVSVSHLIFFLVVLLSTIARNVFRKNTFFVFKMVVGSDFFY